METAELYRRLEGPKTDDDLIEFWKHDGEWIAKSSIKDEPKEVSSAIHALCFALNKFMK